MFFLKKRKDKLLFNCFELQKVKGSSLTQSCRREKWYSKRSPRVTLQLWVQARIEARSDNFQTNTRIEPTSANSQTHAPLAIIIFAGCFRSHRHSNAVRTSKQDFNINSLRLLHLLIVWIFDVAILQLDFVYKMWIVIPGMRSLWLKWNDSKWDKRHYTHCLPLGRHSVNCSYYQYEYLWLALFYIYSSLQAWII